MDGCTDVLIAWVLREHRLCETDEQQRESTQHKRDVLDTFQSESLRMSTLGHEPPRKILGHVLQGAGGGENRKLRRRGIQLSRNPPLKVTSRMF